MVENAFKIFVDSLFYYLTDKTRSSTTGLLIKKHCENIETCGEFSFPNTLKSWQQYFELDRNPKADVKTLLQFIGKSHVNLIDESKTWNLQVSNIKEYKGRVCLFLERSVAKKLGLSKALRNNLLVSQRLQDKYITVTVDPLCEDDNCLTSLRVKYLSKVIENLCSMPINCDVKVPQIFVTSKSSSTRPYGYRILCGTVLSTKTGSKEAGLNANDFIGLRQNEMTLIAQHKYGVRVSTDSKWREYIAHLGESAVAFELLQSRPSSAVKINFDNVSAGASKGASFILYNCARLETIIRTYNDKVIEGIYPPLPKFEDIDWTLLNQEDEWNLIFNYIMGFPSLLESCVDIRDKSCEFRPHYICNFLCSMVRVFSQYYRRTRILVEPRKHLLPTIHARMHLLIILNDTLKTCLKILNIKSVSQM